MNNIKNIKKLMSTIIVMLLSIFCFPLAGRAETTITVHNGNSHLVTGYATEINQEYKVEIFWAADMTFVFDRGKYNPNDGTLDRASSVAGAEMNSEEGHINCWYGFDGIRNRIVVLNRSNMDIYAKYASEIYENICGGNVKSQLYDYANNDNYNLTIEDSGYPSSFDDNNYNDNDELNRFGNYNELEPKELEPGSEKKIKASPADGKMYANKVFLNITGTPSNGFQKYEVVDGKIKTANMGHITITLNKTSSNI